MTELEDRLREQLRRRGDSVDQTEPGLVGQVHAHIRRGNRRRLAVAAASLAVVVATLGVAAGVNPWAGDESPAVVAGDPAPTTAADTDDATRGLTSCVNARVYPEILAKQTLALDATILSKSSDGSMATFTVNRWFRGGDSQTITLPLTDTVPAQDTQYVRDPKYPVGQRLLISARTAEDGSALIWQCDYTRKWSADDADLWQQAFSGQPVGRKPAPPKPQDLTAADQQTLQAAGESFVEFARGAGSLDSTDSVALYVGGQNVKTLIAADLGEPAAWFGCPKAGGYAARICPFSATGPVADFEGQMEVTTDPPSHPCLGAYAVPPEVARMRTVTVTPDADLDCGDYFAIQVFLNDQDQVAAVNVAWAEP